MARPIHSIRAGRVELAIWENTRETGPPFDVTLSRSYKDGETWKTVHNFSAYDVDNLLKAVAEAKGFIEAKAKTEAGQ